MVSAFGDESADEAQQRSFAVAAVGASDDEWKRLENAWLERTGGMPFHATDCESDQGIYADRPHAENKALYKDLVGIIAQSEAWGWGAAYDLKSYREVFPSVNQDMCYLRAFLAVIIFFNDFAKSHFNDIVKYTFMAMIEAEEKGITQANVDEMAKTGGPDVKRFLGVGQGYGQGLGVDDKFAYNIIKQVGNYGESFERNVGQKTPLGLARGLNELWSKGGLQYAPPFN